MLGFLRDGVTHPSWRHCTDDLSSAVCHGDFGGELRHAEVSQEKQSVEVHYVGANAAETTPGR
jgi:hypothetical protein